MIQRIRFVVFLIVALVATTLSSQWAVAAPPKTLGVHGIDLGMTASEVEAVLQRDYKPCGADRTVYRASSPQGDKILAALSINPGLALNDVGIADFCTYSPEGEGVTDSIEAWFVHPDIDPRQPLYRIRFKRLYPDVVMADMGAPRKTYDRLRAELIRAYGRPVDDRRERTVTAASNLATSLGLGRQVKREEFRIRSLWTSSGRLVDDELESSTCACNDPYAKAIVDISRNAAARGKRPFYVLSIDVVLADPALTAKQEAWDAQWQTKN